MATSSRQFGLPSKPRGALPLGPRLAPLCFPGCHSGSASTIAKNWESAARVGCPPPTFVTRSAIHGSHGAPWISALASRKARARACCHAQSRPSGAVSHAAHASPRAMLEKGEALARQSEGLLDCLNTNKERASPSLQLLRGSCSQPDQAGNYFS